MGDNGNSEIVLDPDVIIKSESTTVYQTPTKKELLERNQTKIFSPDNLAINRDWTHHFLYSNVSWVFRCSQRIGNSAMSTGVSVLPVVNEDNPKVKRSTKYVIEGIKGLFAKPNKENTFEEIYKQIHEDLSTHGTSYIIWEFLEKEPPFRTPIAFYRADYRTIRPVRRNEFIEFFGLNDNTLYTNDIIYYCQEIVYDLKSFLEPKGKLAPQMKRTLYNAPWIKGSGNNVRYFYPEQVMEISLNAAGVSPLDTLVYPLATELAAQQYTYSYFKNGTKTGMILALKNGTKPQAEDIRAKIMDSYTNPDTAWRPMVLLGDLNLVRESANTSDVQFLDIRKFTKEEVCAAMGVPSSLVSETAGKANKEEDELSFEVNTVRPMSLTILGKFLLFFINLYPEQRGLIDIVPGVEGKASLHLMKTAQIQLMCGGTINESRKLIGLPEYLDDEIANVPFSAANLMPVNLIKDMIQSKKVGPNPVKDNNPGGQPRDENVQGGRSGVNNEQRIGEISNAV